MKKTLALFTLAAALFSFAAITPSAEAGFGLPKIKVPKIGGPGGVLSKTAASVAVDVTVKDNMSGRPVSDCDIYIIDTNKVPSFRYSGDACYVTTTGNLVGKTDANGHFRTPSVKGTSIRILVFRPRGDVASQYFVSGSSLEFYKIGLGTDRKNMTRLVFE